MLKRWVPASFIAIAMALAIAGGAVLAVGNGQDSRRADVFERAATILGIDPSDLQNAHDQANREAQDEQLTAEVERLVTFEMINQSEANSFTSWISDRPDSADDTLFSKLTSSIIGTPWVRTAKIEINRLPTHGDSEIIVRMAEILGLDSQTLENALDQGKVAADEQNRLVKFHALVDEMLASEAITDDEANELHSWIDRMPLWLLDLDISSRMLSTSRLFSTEQRDSNFPKRLPFGTNRFGDGEHEFRFEFKGPQGNFRFGPGERDFPIRPDGLEGLEDLDKLQGLFDQFEGHRFFESPFEGLIPPTIEPETSGASA
ncbi:MAG: hypothetical protein HQ477_07360 [Chloroflexi bacterium]|nr:hypothetical protein [Chloroflexota bacterium]